MFPIGDENEPGRGIAYVTLAIIALNLLVFVGLQLPDERFTYGYAAVPAEITEGRDLTRPTEVEVAGESYRIPQAPGPEPIQLTLLTSMFMHGGWLHLLGNMLFLWIFGDNVEHRLGRVAFPLFYLLAGLAGSLAQIALDPSSTVPTLGASGAISGVLGAYLVLFPGNRVTVFLFRFVTVVPAIVAIGMWAILQFINGFGAIAATEETVGGVAYMAHIGGFVVGVALGLLARGMGGGSARPRYG
ncbi:MAG TPA: rhomboid family intramembrane serine protease [Candidatus Limnocylindrales bacterium]|nr:rhomboid family intramembrane serine protease [Candidatus Limnocylindrales bacterium]